MFFPRIVPRAALSGQPEEKSDHPELRLEEYHSFEYRISDLNSWTVTVKSDRPSQRRTVNPDRSSPERTARVYRLLCEGWSDFTVTVHEFRSDILYSKE